MEEAERMREWLRELGTLSSELEAGMMALAACRLDEFSIHRRRQQALCRQLESRIALHREAQRTAAGDHTAAAQIAAAAKRADRLNRQLSFFLHHAGRLLRARMALERGLAGQLHSRPRNHIPHHSWSCEA